MNEWMNDGWKKGNGEICKSESRPSVSKALTGLLPHPTPGVLKGLIGWMEHANGVFR